MMTKEEIIDMAKKCGWDNPAINMSPLYEFAKLIAEKSKQEQDMPVAIIENNSQNWKGMDGSIAWHLIERHAENWNQVGEMMNEWLGENQKEWVGLTDEEIQECLQGLPTQTIDVYARRIETKIKDKNT